MSQEARLEIDFPDMPSPAESIPSSQGSQEPPRQVAAVLPDSRIQVPIFWRTRAREWFAFAKATLRSHGWRAENRIRDAIIANLPEDVLVHLGEALVNLESLTLARLEEDVCAAYRSPEAQSKLDVFLDSLSPGTMEPATALKTIRDFCGGANAREQTLFTFLKRVLHPVVRQQMAAFSEEPIDVFCRRAQNLHLAHVASSSALPAVQCPALQPTTEEMPPPYTAAALPAAPRRTYTAPPEEDYHAIMDLCPQHQRFGRRAQRCDPPCAWRRLYGRREADDHRRAPTPPSGRQLTQKGREHFKQKASSQNSRSQGSGRNNPRSQGGGRNNSREYYSPERDHHYEEPYNKSQGNA